MVNKPTKSKPKTHSCDYHSCYKKLAVSKCEYCKEYFCKKHLYAIPPGPPRFNGTSFEDLLFMEEWRKDGHPCPEYYKEWEKKVKKEKQEYTDALDIASGRTPRSNGAGKKITIVPVYGENWDDNEPLFEDDVGVANEEPIRPDDVTEEEEEIRGPKITIKKRRRKIDWLKLIGLSLLLLLIFVFLVGNQIITLPDNVNNYLGLTCDDGTIIKTCSNNDSYYCQGNATLIYSPDKCGCPEDYKEINNTCELIQRCEDGTIYGNCVKNDEPWMCFNGVLKQKATVCGCGREETPRGDVYISKYMTGKDDRTYTYLLRGDEFTLKLYVYEGLYTYLGAISRSISYTSIAPTTEDFIRKNIDDDEQLKLTTDLSEKIQSRSNSQDDQARIAISLVQMMPYDYVSLESGNSKSRYAYEVLFDETGVCGEKSQLLALLLRELGYGVALFNYDLENHQALGIKCPEQYDYKDTGYCFVETTSPTIITVVPDNYVNAGALKSTPEVIVISEGESFDSVGEEYADALLWEKIGDMGPRLSQSNYRKWTNLVEKYRIIITE